MAELIKPSVKNLLKRDLTHVRKSCEVLYHAAASVKLYTNLFNLIHTLTDFLVAHGQIQAPPDFQPDMYGNFEILENDIFNHTPG